MDWQDRLRELDAQLARGELSQGEYRSRRDELLAEASSAPALRRHPGSRPPTGPIPVMQPPPRDLFSPVPQQPPTAPVAGGEVFSTAGEPAKGRRAALIAVAVLVVAAVALWVVLLEPFSGDGAAEPAAPKSLAELVPTPEGRPNPKNGVLTVAAAAEANILTAAGAEALTAGGVLEVVFRSSFDGELGTAVIAGRAASPDAAAKTVTRLHANLLARGFRELGDPLVDGPTAVKENADNRYHSAVFAIGDVVVQISLSQPVGADAADLAAALRDTSAAVSNALRTG
ncbi:SHOCT domain-containing protein [Actinokineospora sp. NPDC004072]